MLRHVAKIYMHFQGSPFVVGSSTQHERNMEATSRVTQPEAGTCSEERATLMDGLVAPIFSSGTRLEFVGRNGGRHEPRAYRFPQGIECSVFVAPLEPGLSYEEPIEVGKRANYQQGEVGDALRFVTTQHFGTKRLLPDHGTAASWAFFTREEPDYRNFDAFDFVISELNALARAAGAASALMQRSVMVERAVAKGIPRHDVEVAITYQVMADILVERGAARFPAQPRRS